MPAGRPTLFSKQLADEICRRLANGETLRGMCRDNDHLPERTAVSDWIATKEEFAHRVACAREAGSHVLIEETRDIADDGSNDWMEKHGRDSVGWTVNGEHVQRSKLRIEQRWREAEAILPKVYGKRQMVEHSGTVGVVIGELSDEDLSARLLELVTTGRLKLPAGGELIEVDEPEPEPTPPDEDEDCPW